MNNIDKFNNQYLKCIVTKYSSAINALANSGALIVYHPNSNNIDINKNYIYLGDEFLASGYGFPTKELQEKGVEIAKNYDSQITSLKNTDTSLAKKISEAINERNELLTNYILSDGGTIDKTIINFDGQHANTKDLILFGEPAKYKNLEITNINVKINDKLIDENNNVYLPLGTCIKKFDIYIDYEINDSGGIYKIEAIHKNIKYYNINSENNGEDESIVIKYDQDSNGNAQYGTVHYQKIFSRENAAYVIGEINNIISSFNIYVEGTPTEKYKNYPILENKFDIHIKSIGNIIIQNKIEIIKGVNIKPIYTLYYNSELTYEALQNSNMLITSNELELSINGNPQNLYIAIPNIFKINKLYVVDDYDNKYNWTGILRIKNNNITLLTSISTSEWYQSPYYSNYDLYNIKAENGIDSNKIIIKLEQITNNDNDNSYELIETAPSNVLSFNYEDAHKLNDEEFNSLYWVNLNGVNLKNNVYSILNDVSYKC